MPPMQTRMHMYHFVKRDMNSALSNGFASAHFQRFNVKFTRGKYTGQEFSVKYLRVKMINPKVAPACPTKRDHTSQPTQPFKFLHSIDCLWDERVFAHRPVRSD